MSNSMPGCVVCTASDVHLVRGLAPHETVQQCTAAQLCRMLQCSALACFSASSGLIASPTFAGDAAAMLGTENLSEATWFQRGACETAMHVFLWVSHYVFLFRRHFIPVQLVTDASLHKRAQSDAMHMLTSAQTSSTDQNPKSLPTSSQSAP